MFEGAQADFVDELIAQNRRVARETARLLRLVVQVADTAPVAEFGIDEVAFALTWTRQAALNQEQLARRLITGLPEVFAALARGEIDLPKARVFVDALAVLDAETARGVAAQVLPIAPEKTTAQIRDRLHRRALAADPEAARKRRHRAERDRRVILDSCADGTAALTALGLPALRAAAAMERVNAIARARRRAGETLTMDQLRADSLLDLLEGVGPLAHPGPRRGVIELTVGLDTLACLDFQPGLGAGYGPVAADIARQWTLANPGYQWRYSIRDPETGGLLFQGLTNARPDPAGPSTSGSAAAEPDTARAPSRTRVGTWHTKPAPPGSRPLDPASDNVRPRPGRRPSAYQGTSSGSGSGSGQDRAARDEAAPQDEPAQQNKAERGEAVLRNKAAQQNKAERGEAVQRNEPAQRGKPVPRPPGQDPAARFANAATVRWIRSRDRTCRAPGCRVPASACDIDHTAPFAQGGRTVHDRLGLVCRHHHRLRHESGWQLHQPAPGVFRWTSPAGRIYQVGPEPP